MILEGEWLVKALWGGRGNYSLVLVDVRHDVFQTKVSVGKLPGIVAETETEAALEEPSMPGLITDLLWAKLHFAEYLARIEFDVIVATFRLGIVFLKDYQVFVRYFRRVHSITHARSDRG